MPLRTDLLVRLDAPHSKAGDLISPAGVHQLVRNIILTDGTGADQADRAFSDQRQLAASASENLDVAGSLVDIFGATLSLARVRLLIVEALTTNTNNVNVTMPASNGVPGIFLTAGDGVSLRPGGLFVWASRDATGAVVTAGTGDLITVANSGGGSVVDYKVVIIGASA